MLFMVLTARAEVGLFCRYRANTVLGLLERNIKIKEKPERFQSSENRHDILVSFDHRAFEAIIERSILYLAVGFLRNTG